MPRPKHDAVEIARSVLAELPTQERAELLITLIAETRDLRLLALARNRITDEIEELILDGALEGIE